MLERFLHNPPIVPFAWNNQSGILGAIVFRVNDEDGVSGLEARLSGERTEFHAGKMEDVLSRTRELGAGDIRHHQDTDGEPNQVVP